MMHFSQIYPFYYSFFTHHHLLTFYQFLVGFIMLFSYMCTVWNTEYMIVFTSHHPLFSLSSLS
jgi:hypothetical protein